MSVAVAVPRAVSVATERMPADRVMPPWKGPLLAVSANVPAPVLVRPAPAPELSTPPTVSVAPAFVTIQICASPSEILKSMVSVAVFTVLSSTMPPLLSVSAVPEVSVAVPFQTVGCPTEAN